MKLEEIQSEYPLIAESLFNLARDNCGRTNPKYNFPDSLQLYRINSALKQIQDMSADDLNLDGDVLEDCWDEDLIHHFVYGDDDIRQAITSHLGADGAYANWFFDQCFQGIFYNAIRY